MCPSLGAHLPHNKRLPLSLLCLCCLGCAGTGCWVRIPPGAPIAPPVVLALVSSYAHHALQAAHAAGASTPTTPTPQDYQAFEPSFTHAVPSFVGTLDYIFIQEGRCVC